MMNRFWTILALIVMVSCSKGDELDLVAAPTEDVISWDIDTEQINTKAELVNDVADMGTVGIYCAHTAQEPWSVNSTFDKMSNTRLTYNPTTELWGYDSGEKYTWDYTSANDRYTFYGYSPYANLFAGINSYLLPRIDKGELVVEYNVSTDCTQQVDLMIARPLKDIYHPATGKVALKFEHALAAIAFKVVGNGSTKITSISISGIKDHGKVMWDYTNDCPKWSSLSSSSDTKTFSAKINAEVTPNPDEAQDITTVDGYLMMIPQEIPESGITVRALLSDKKFKEFTITPDITPEWSVGMKHTYVLGADILKFYEENKGTADDPFQMETIEDIELLAQLVNTDETILIKGDTESKACNGFQWKYFEMPNDIVYDSSVVNNHTAIGFDDGGYWKFFRGYFDGCGNAIRGLNMDVDSDYQGFFGSTSYPSITKNLDIYGTIKGKKYVGGLVGRIQFHARTGFENCNNYANVTASEGYCGGIAGYFDGWSQSITGCNNYGAITSNSTSDAYTGGITGYTQKTRITDCENHGIVTTKGIYTGGIVGYSDLETEISGCTNFSKISAIDEACGGIAGYITDDSAISDCTNEGEVKSDSYYVGGIAGRTNRNNTIKNTTNKAAITGDYNCGGIVGYADVVVNVVTGSILEIENCSNSGDVTAAMRDSAMNSNAGGIIGGTGEFEISVKECTNSGSILAGPNAYANIGGIIGLVKAQCTIENCANEGSVKTTRSYAGGIVARYITDDDNKELTIKNCRNKGGIVTDIMYSGGIIGYAVNKATIEDCFNEGTIYGCMMIGGIAGVCNYVTINRCYNSKSGIITTENGSAAGVIGRINKNSIVINSGNEGAIKLADNRTGKSTYTAGVVSYIEGASANETIIANCYNTGEISGDSYTAGIITRSYAHVTNCYNSGTINCSSFSSATILSNTNYGTYENCYYRSDCCSNSSVGTSLSASAMKESGFAATLINNAVLFNEQTPAPAIKACAWKAGGSLNSGYAIHDPSAPTPQRTKFSVAYISGSKPNTGSAYFITDLEDLLHLSKNASDHDENPYCSFDNCSFVLTADIDLTGVTEFIPIGSGKSTAQDYNVFRGKFDGGGHTIKLDINAGFQGDFQGLFGRVEDATLMNINITGSIKTNSGSNIGGVVGYAKNTLINHCSNAATITDKDDGYCIGGIAGRIEGNSEIINCYNIGDITISTEGASYTGGIAGYIYYEDRRITNCFNRGNITGDDEVAGIAPFKASSEIINCYNTGTVTTVDNHDHGAISTGYNDDVTNCYYTIEYTDRNGDNMGTQMTETAMKNTSFANTLNGYVDTYNTSYPSRPQAYKWKVEAGINDTLPTFEQ